MSQEKKQTLAPKGMYISQIDFHYIFEQIGLLDKNGCSYKVRVSLMMIAMLINFLDHVHLPNKVMELDIGQYFCQAISDHLLC